MIGVCTFTSLAAGDDKAPLVKSYQTDKAHYEYGEPITFTLEIEEGGID